MNTATTGYKTWVEIHLPLTPAERAIRDQIQFLDAARLTARIVAGVIALAASLAPFTLFLAM
jgi:hypothetical protein